MKKFLQALQMLFILCLVFGAIFLWQDQGGFYTRLFAWSLFGFGSAGCAVWTVFGLWQKLETGGGLPLNCPDCGEKLPLMFRMPKSRREILWGGVTCPKCGLQLDRAGKRVGGNQEG